MKSIRNILAASALLLPAVALSTPAHAQTSDSQLWTSASVQAKLGSNLKLSNELVLRFGDAKDGLYEVENSTLLGYALSKKVTIWGGYVHNPNYAFGDFTVMERRAREQVTFDNIAKLGKASMSARLRLEQRWRDHVDGTGWRVRPYAKLALPLGDKSKPTLNLTEELFVNLNTVPFQSQDGLDRARTGISLSQPLTKTLKAEVGYLNQHRFINGKPDTDDHAMTVALGFSF